MTTEREKIIQLAKRLSVVEDGIHLFDEIALVAFYHIAQKEILEQAAKVCEETVAAIEGQLCAEEIRQLIKE